MKLTRWMLVNILILAVTAFGLGSLRHTASIPDPNQAIDDYHATHFVR